MKNRFVAILSFLSVTLFTHASDRVVYEGQQGPGQGKHVVLVSGDEEYRSEQALTQIGRILAKHHGFRCTVLFAIDPQTGMINPRVRDNIPGLDTLKDADLMVVFTRWRILPDSQMKHIDDYVKTGKPIVGLRTSTHAFAPKTEVHVPMRQWARMAKRNPDKAGPQPQFTDEQWGPYGRHGDGYYGSNKKWAGGFGKYIIGEMWVAHHGHHKHESTRGVIAPETKKHPVLRGIKGNSIWGSTDVYTVNLPLPGDSKPLVLGQVVARAGEYDESDLNYGMRPSDTQPVKEKNAPMMPIAWTKTYSDNGNTGRVFSTTMGSSADLANAPLRRLVINGIYWAAGLEKKIPPRGAKVDLVGEFNPVAYGFVSDDYWIEQNLAPSDFAWSK
ncbi:MAG: ThuA domain-containing protein [Limisphaerales bacterium]